MLLINTFFGDRVEQGTKQKDSIVLSEQYIVPRLNLHLLTTVTVYVIYCIREVRGHCFYSHQKVPREINTNSPQVKLCTNQYTWSSFYSFRSMGQWTLTLVFTPNLFTNISALCVGGFCSIMPAHIKAQRLCGADYAQSHCYSPQTAVERTPPPDPSLTQIPPLTGQASTFKP